MKEMLGLKFKFCKTTAKNAILPLHFAVHTVQTFQVINELPVNTFLP